MTPTFLQMLQSLCYTLVGIATTLNLSDITSMFRTVARRTDA